MGHMQQMTEFHPGRPRILIVDDDGDLRLTLCEHAASMNLVVSSVPDGTEAIRMLRHRGHEFDIVLTDLMMPPGPSGLDVLRVAKEVHPFTYVIIMTGFSSIETAIESIRRGAFDYIAKPFQLLEMEIRINRVREHLCLLDDNRRLSAKLASLTSDLESIDSRLGRIEAMLSRIGANRLAVSENALTSDS
jgi:DNA-binding NtrC family response regulator